MRPRAGTPVMAAADGVVEDVGRRGNYGNYILVRHSGRLETAYAHLAGFAPVVAAGTPVHRGDVIGYVGMTGVATGPHLYYEVIVDGRQIDPEGAALKQATRAYRHADRAHQLGPTNFPLPLRRAGEGEPGSARLPPAAIQHPLRHDERALRKLACIPPCRYRQCRRPCRDRRWCAGTASRR